MNAPAQTRAAPVYLADIADVVCAAYGIDMSDLRARSRAPADCLARHAGFFLGVKLTDRSLVQIADYFGRQNHTTVIHGVRRIEGMIAADAGFADEIAGMETAAREIATMRRSGELPEPEEIRHPIEVARSLLAIARSGSGAPKALRAVTRVSAMQIVDICAELVRLDDARLAAEAAEAAREAAAVADTQEAAKAAIARAVHGFLGVEAFFRANRSRRLGEDRMRALRALRGSPVPQVMAVVAAFDEMRRDEFTPFEKPAIERYEAAIAALTRFFADELATMEDADA